jgi:hypothetical protein
MCLALQHVGIACEVTSFTTNHPKKRCEAAELLRQALVEGEEHGVSAFTYAREMYHADITYRGSAKDYPVLVPKYRVLKHFDEIDLTRIAALKAESENLDGEAVLWQARRLAKRGEHRRVMFVLSDGRPAGHRPGVDGQGYLRDAVRRVEDAGIEVYGIGIQDDSVCNYYARSWVVYSLQDLQTVAMGAMIEVLTEARQEKRCVSI